MLDQSPPEQVTTAESTEADTTAYPFRAMPYHPPGVRCTRHEDGTITLASTIPLVDVEPGIAQLFRERARRHPQRLWLAEKNAAGAWAEITYGRFDEQSDRIAQWLLDRDMGQHTPLMILSENSLAHALLTMGAMKAQVPVAPVSAPYSLLDPQFRKLRTVVEVLQPAAVFAECAERYAGALVQVDDGKRCLIVNKPGGTAHTTVEDILGTTAGDQVAESMDRIDADTIAKYMFTSGSTGTPKCVVQTQHMLCAQVAGLKSIRAVTTDNYPVSLQWMPWSHVSAGNISYHEAILNGGSIYIDDGRPMPGLFEKTLANLRDISTTVFGSVPLGLGWLATALEADPALQATFFKQLEAIAYGGSALPENISRRLQLLSIRNTGRRIPIISMYGSTETQGITATYWPTDTPGIIGLPMPGMTLKLVPCANKLEVRVKGPTVLTQYLGQPALTRSSFDEDGFFKLGDAAKFIDDTDPVKGLLFDGRISEDFKLLSGTWVSTVAVKGELLKAFGNLIRDLVVCGENRSFVSALVWLDPAVAAEFAGEDNAEPQQLICHPRIEQYLREKLMAYNDLNPGSSTAVKTVMILQEGPSLAKSEINEKGYINAAVLTANRHALLESVYRDKPGEQPSIIHALQA